MRRLVTVFALLLLVTGTLSAQAPSVSASTGEPDRFLQAFAERAIASLTEQGVERSELAKRFSGLLEEGFDIPEISKFVTARYWRAATEEQKEAFNLAFRDYLVQRFLPLFDEYSDQPFETAGVRADAAEADVSWVTIAVQVGETEAATEWKLKKTSSDFKILDVKAEGTSMALTLRDEFQAFMKRKGGLDGLTAALRKQAKKAGVSASSN